MTKWICVAAAAFALLGTAAPHPASSHGTVRIPLTRVTTFSDAHVFLGIAVLGHRVGHIECGYLFLPPPRGWVHVDWTRCGNWDGLTAGPPSASDTTPQQMDATIRAINHLGFASNAIRSWMTVAPVGYDAYNTGAKTLRIGEILVDLGPAASAEAAFKRFWKENGPDALDSVPANIGYAFTFYVQPDCTAYERQLREQFLHDATLQAGILSIASRQHVTFHNISIRHSTDVLCPAGVQPQFKSTRASAWTRMDPQSISDEATATIDFDVAPGSGVEIAAPPLPAHAQAIVAPELLPMPVSGSDAPPRGRYAKTLGQSELIVKPDTVLIEAQYEIATPAWKLYEKSNEERAAAISALAKLVPASDMLQRRDDSSGTPTAYVYVRLRHPSAQHFNDVLASAKRRDFAFEDSLSVHRFVDDCTPYYRYILQDALRQSAQKGAAAANVLKTQLGGIAAAIGDGSTDAVCGLPSSSSIGTLAAAAPTTSWSPGECDFAATFTSQLMVAWTLGDGEAAPSALTEQSYSGVENEEPGTDCAGMPIRALRQAIESALIDGQRVWSLSEQRAVFGKAYGNGCYHDVTENVTVLSAGRGNK